MRTLLIQPPEGSAFGVSKVFLPEPLGLELVAGALTPDGHQLKILDLRLDRLGMLERTLREFRPDAVGIACAFTSEVLRVREVTAAERLRALKHGQPSASEPAAAPPPSP